MYLLGVINSKTSDYNLQSIGSTKQGGFFEYKPMYVSKIPIPVVDDRNKAKVMKLASQLSKLNEEIKEVKLQTQIDQIKSKIDYCENRINEIVYQLYGLTEEEIKIIEGN